MKILQKEDENTDWSYRLTIFKKTYQSTKPLKIKSNLDDLKTLQQLYLEFHPRDNEIKFKCCERAALRLFGHQVTNPSDFTAFSSNSLFVFGCIYRVSDVQIERYVD
jgi:hypothetical protein